MSGLRGVGLHHAAASPLTSVLEPIIMPSVTPSIMSGLPALPIPQILPYLTPMSAYHCQPDPGVRRKASEAYLEDTAPIDHQGVCNHQVQHFAVVPIRGLTHPIANRFPCSSIRKGRGGEKRRSHRLQICTRPHRQCNLSRLRPKYPCLPI